MILKNDPHEMNNLAQDPRFHDTLVKMREKLIATIQETKDLGFIPEPIAEELGQKYGNKYFILDQPENEDLLNKCLIVMKMDEEIDLKGLRVMMHDNEKAVRFWAAYGLGNVVAPLNEETLLLLTVALEDDSDAVKIAAARSLCKLGHVDPALQVLKENLNNQNLLVGLYAALFVEELDQKVASQILPAIKEAQNSPYDFTLRVINRMVNNLGKDVK
jgi:N-sulfoglucosamine sulfohydrolase